MTPRMNLLYVHAESIGYGRLGVKLAEAIGRAGVTTFDDLPDPVCASSKFIPPGARSAVCNHVSWVSTPGHCRGWWKGQSKAILTMWESNTLPEPFRESLDSFDTVVVPSEQNRELFARYHPNVRYVPLGIDPRDWHPVPRPAPTSTFRFLISGGGKRKGSDLAIAAFRKVFESWRGPVPELYLHTAKAVEIPGDDRIHVISGKLDPEDEIALYATSHAFVFPSRGEGFGLRPLQAIAQGMPTIATDAHGHRAFSHLMTHPLPWTLTETPPASFHHGPAGSWWEPDFDALCEAMLDVYENYERHVAAAEENGRIACATLNWDETARKYLDAIGRDNLELPDLEPAEWVTPPIRRYLVRVTQPRMMEVGGVQYRLEPWRWEKCEPEDEEAVSVLEAFGDLGEVPMRLADATHVKRVRRDYWEPADVKRILFESDSLDLSCLPQNLDEETDHGLTPEQLERMRDYSGAFALCSTCGNKLNRGRPTLEELESLPMPVER